MARVSDLEGQSLIEIANYHNDAVDALTFYLRFLSQQNNLRFLGYTPDELNNFIRGRIEETEIRSSMAILASIEAALRIDFILRARLKLKDPISRDFRDIYKEKREKVLLDEDILESWRKHHPSLKKLVGEFRASLHFRHWVAHGRYWDRPAHGKFDYSSIYDLADLIFSNFPLCRN